MIHLILLAHSFHGPAFAAHAAAIVQGVAHAVQAPPPGGGPPTDIKGVADKITGAINEVFKYFLPVGLALCALYYGWGGLHYIAAGGSPTLVQTARRIWWHATVGVVGVILATPVVTMVHGLFT